MLQVARLAPTLLGESRDLVRDFYLQRLNADGGFQDRAGDSDLYYTVFGLEGLAALEHEMPATTPGFLETFTSGHRATQINAAGHRSTPINIAGHRSTPINTASHRSTQINTEGHGSTQINPAGHGSTPINTAGHRSTQINTEGHRPTQINTDLDFVHLTCLARAWATVARGGAPPEVRGAIRERIETFRSRDGGYSVAPQAERGTPYGCFLALGAIEDLGGEPDDRPAMLSSVLSLRTPDGGFANHAGAAEGSTPATAAAVLVMRHLDAEPDARVAEWLLARAHGDGGFFAAPNAPVPDLLSTATALHALVAMHADIASIKEPCLDFVDSLWTNAGGFCGSWLDQTLDCEYTYYGLLALGHLSL